MRASVGRPGLGYTCSDLGDRGREGEACPSARDLNMSLSSLELTLHRTIERLRDRLRRSPLLRLKYYIPMLGTRYPTYLKGDHSDKTFLNKEIMGNTVNYCSIYVCGHQGQSRMRMRQACSCY